MIYNKVEAFDRAIISGLDKHAPVKQIKVSTRKKPWVNLDIRKMMQERNRIFEKPTELETRHFLNSTRKLELKLKIN